MTLQGENVNVLSIYRIPNLHTCPSRYSFTPEWIEASLCQVPFLKVKSHHNPSEIMKGAVFPLRKILLGPKWTKLDKIPKIVDFLNIYKY